MQPTPPKVTVFLDSNLVLQGKPLDELPWEQIDQEGPIEILVVPKVASEIDSKKQDGRLTVIARTFNRMIAPLALGTLAEVVIRAASPRVVLSLAYPSPINWEDYQSLEPGDSDSRVVAVSGAVVVDSDLGGAPARNRRAAALGSRRATGAPPRH